MMRVYLCGPITGASYSGAVDWRAFVAERLSEAAVCAVSPMRGKSYLAQVTKIASEYPQLALSSARGITTRDRWDATRCDILLANFCGAEKVSIGSVMEIAWADSRRIPIVVAMEKGNVHDHPMLRECAGYVLPTFDEAVSLILALAEGE
jgi:hypothetical protein